MNNSTDKNDASTVDGLVQKVLKRVKKKISGEEILVHCGGKLDEVLRQDLERRLLAKFPRAPKVVFVRDDTLIAGIRISYGDYLYEDSLQEELKKLRHVIEEQ